jgi:hypothetical protein
MKLAIIVSSFAVSLALCTLTGCAVTSEGSEESRSAEEEKPGVEKKADDQKQAEKEMPQVDDSHVAPAMRCILWDPGPPRRCIY